MEIKQLIKSKKNIGATNPKFLIISVIAVLFAFISVFIFVKHYSIKMAEYKSKTAQLQQLSEENLKLQREKAELERKIAYLNTKNGVESVAREKLGLIKSSEVAFVVVKDKSVIKEEHPSVKSVIENANPKQKPIEEKKSNWFLDLWKFLTGKKE